MLFEFCFVLCFLCLCWKIGLFVYSYGFFFCRFVFEYYIWGCYFVLWSLMKVCDRFFGFFIWVFLDFMRGLDFGGFWLFLFRLMWFDGWGLRFFCIMDLGLLFWCCNVLFFFFYLGWVVFFWICMWGLKMLLLGMFLIGFEFWVFFCIWWVLDIVYCLFICFDFVRICVIFED